VVANSAGTLVTDSGTAGTKGAWAQLIGSTASDIAWLAISIASQASLLTTAFVDIGIGAAGSEVVVLSNLMLSVSGEDPAPAQYVLPVYIPARTRIAARCMSADGSENVAVSISAWDGAMQSAAPVSAVDAIGITGTTPTGVTVPATGAVGAYVELVASTANDYSGFLLGFTSSQIGLVAWIDVAVGVAGSEQLILPSYHITWDNGGCMVPRNSFYIPTPIRAGSRVAARIGSEYTQTSGAVGVSMYGVRQ
jgi:hypothetical protein